MPHVLEHATTGRARCRGCGASIPKDTLRVGEAVPNMFAETDGAEATHWYHPVCAAYRRPEAFLQAVEGTDLALPERDDLVAIAAEGVAHHRLPRLDKAERAPTARAACRHCRVAIPKDAWRIALLFWQDGRFAPAGFVHASCAPAYFETADLLGRVRRATPALTDTDAEALAREFAAPPPAAPPAGE
jgi:Poly(ADP-ribose) polymerase and DNA-Ligase Zn-finger region